MLQIADVRFSDLKVFQHSGKNSKILRYIRYFVVEKHEGLRNGTRRAVIKRQTFLHNENSVKS